MITAEMITNTKELYTGTPNSDIRITHIMYCTVGGK